MCFSVHRFARGTNKNFEVESSFRTKLCTTFRLDEDDWKNEMLVKTYVADVASMIGIEHPTIKQSKDIASDLRDLTNDLKATVIKVEGKDKKGKWFMLPRPLTFEEAMARAENKPSQSVSIELVRAAKELLHHLGGVESDAQYIAGLVQNIQPTQRKKAMETYAMIWKRAYADEPMKNRKQGKARQYANNWLRERVEGQSAQA